MANRSKVSRSRAASRRVVGLRVEGRTYHAVLTPDRKAGGYWVTVRKCPGCVTEGDTLAEAKRMAREAIALWVGHAATQVARATRKGS